MSKPQYQKPMDIARQEVDVIVNVYNEEKNICDFLDSLLEQSYDNFRVVIADDGSTDKTVALAENYLGRLNLEILQLPHLGLRGARAKAVSTVLSDIFIVFDADQIIDRFAVERFLETFEDMTVGAVTGRKISKGNTWTERGNRVVTEIAYKALNQGGNSEQLSGGCFACRTQPVRGFGGFSGFDKHAEDSELTWRLQENGWRTVARDDIIVYHQDPIGSWEMIKWGWRMGRLGVYTRMKYKAKLFRWHFLVRFSLLVLLMIALFSPVLALIGMIANICLFLLKARSIQASFLDKLLGWGVFTLKSFGWSLAFCKVFVEYIFNQWQGGDVVQTRSESNVIS